MREIYVRLWLLLLLSIPAGCSREQPAPAAENTAVAISAAVMPLPAPGQTTAAIYLNLINNTSTTLVINYIEASISDHIEVHRNYYENGMMKMRPVAHVSIEPGGKMQFTPGGYHLMVFDMSAPPADGENVTLTIHFEGGQSVTGKVSVRPLTL